MALPLPPPGALRIGLACSRAMRARCLDEAALARLSGLGTLAYEPFEEPSSWTEPPPWKAETEARLAAFAAGLDALLIGPGAPRVTDAVLAATPSLRFVGELEGDRFARRVDLAATDARKVKVVDTTQGSSDPVAEWALALSLMGLRNAGELFRRLVRGETVDRDWKKTQAGYRVGELTGKRVGLVGCGFIGRRLLQLMKPFAVDAYVYDPHLPRVLADVLDITVTSLDRLFSDCDVVVCTVPLTEETHRLIGARELALLRADSVFVNVGRGAVVDTEALVERLQRGDIVACLDVMDPEPIPADSPLRSMDNVFLSPHIAGVTAQCGPRFVTLVADEIERFFSGHETRFDLRPRE
jgi:phosphoglycerate dehydrogenase-like enzyme